MRKGYLIMSLIVLSAQLLAATEGEEAEPTYRQRPASDIDHVKPVIRQPVFPSKRPQLNMEPSTVPRDVFSPTPQRKTTFERQKYHPPKVEPKTNPFAEPRRIYEFDRQSYEAPRDDTKYNIQIERFPQMRETPSDLYTPPESSTLRTRDALRTRSQEGSFYRPSVHTEEMPETNKN